MKGRCGFMATVNYEKMKIEVDALALRYKTLKNKGELTHKEQKECYDCISEISSHLLNYAIVETHRKGVYDESPLDTDNTIVWKTIEYTLTYYLKNDEKEYFNLFSDLFKNKKLNDIVDGYLKENRRGKYNDRYVDVGVDADDNTENAVYDAQSLSNYTSEQNRNSSLYDIIEMLMKETREIALEKGNKYVDRTRGFWTIRLILCEIRKNKAEDWEIYIILWFFNKYLNLGYDNKQLMLLMCEVLGNIKVDTLRKEFDHIIKFIRDNHPYIFKRLR